MGEAKRKRSRHDRIAKAQGLEERPLSEIKKMLGLPDSAEFCGYAVHHVEKDEFLANIEDTFAISKRVWAKTPELAKYYDNYGEVYKDSQKCDGSIIVGVFDVGNQLYVANVT